MAARPVPSPSTPPRRLPAPVPRDVVDHALVRRALLRQVLAGGLLTRTSPDDVRDAGPELLRAAQESGRETSRPCPLCGTALRDVSWVFGEALGALSGTARTPVQLAALALRRNEFDVYDVEVCSACRWNHVLRTWRAGRPPVPDDTVQDRGRAGTPRPARPTGRR